MGLNAEPGSRQACSKRRDSDGQRCKAQTSDQEREDQAGHLFGRESKQQRTDDRAQQQEWTECQPMTGDFGGRNALIRNAADGELVEHAVGAVRLDQPFDRKQCRGQRCNPEHAPTDPGEEAHVRPDRKRHQ